MPQTKHYSISVERNPIRSKTLTNGTKQLVFSKQLYKNSEVDDEIGISYVREVAYKDAAGNAKVTNIIDNQSIACDSSYIYILRVVYRESGYNIVAVYDWNGENIGAYRVDINDEAENLAIVDGKFYMGVNEGGESRGGNSANDYFVKLKMPSLTQDQ